MPGSSRQIGWRFTSGIFDGIPFEQERARRVSTGEYRGRRKIRLKWRGWLPNPPIHQSYAGHQWRYCFKFVAQPLSRGRRGAWCVHLWNGREKERERGYEVLSSLSLVSCTTSRRKTSRVASRAWNLIQCRWKEICRKNFLRQFFNAIPLSCFFSYLVEIRTNDVT